MLADIILRVNNFMQTVTDGEGKTSPPLSDSFSLACKGVFDKHFGTKPERQFTLRPSNLGRPHCQLIAEKEGWPREPAQYDFVMKMFVGDLIEVSAAAIMEAAGCKIEARSKKVEGDLFGRHIQGELDIIVDGKIYDIKSVSKWVFDHKTGDARSFVGDGDSFGYLGQGFIYEHLDGAHPFGGWICICKEDGRWTVVELKEPDYSIFKADALKLVEANLNAADAGQFSRAFTDEPETFRKSETGNRTLKFACSWCSYKWKCWPGLKLLPSFPSEAKNKASIYYTHIDPKWLKDKDAVP